MDKNGHEHHDNGMLIVSWKNHKPTNHLLCEIFTLKPVFWGSQAWP